MAKDDDLLPEDQPADNILPEDQAQAGGAAPAAEPEAPARAAADPAAPVSPVAAELSSKPGNNVWTMLMLISILAMIAGIWIQAQELNEIFKINIIPGSKTEETATQPPTQPDPGTGGAGTATDATATPPATPDKAGDKTGDVPPATPKADK
jgi:hypothetical protein